MDVAKVLSKKETTSLKQVALFLNRFSRVVLENSDGLIEYKFVEELYTHLEEAEQWENIFKRANHNDQPKIIILWQMLCNDLSLLSIIKRKLERIKQSGDLISEEELIRRNLLRREQFEYIGWSNTSQK